jgi:voltage-gated potassium channel
VVRLIRYVIVSPSPRKLRPIRRPTSIWGGIRHRTYELLDDRPFEDPYDAFVSIASMLLIFANIIALSLESIPSFERRYGEGLEQFETFSIWVFTLEYLLRIWSCVEEKRFSSPVRGRLRYILRPMALVDLVSILPSFLPFFGIDLRFVRIFRTFRIFRVAKLTRYSQAFTTLGRVVNSKKEELVAVLFLEAVLLVAISFTVYLLEHDTQPEVFSTVPVALGWGVSTLLNIGTTTIQPITPAGTFVAGAVAILGLGLFALPAGILSSAFLENYRKSRAHKRRLKRIQSPKIPERKAS